MQLQEQKQLIYKDIIKKKKKWVDIPIDMQAISIQKDKGKEQVPPILLTLKIAGKNLHNCLVDSRLVGNIMPSSIWKRLGFIIIYSPMRVT